MLKEQIAAIYAGVNLGTKKQKPENTGVLPI
jgi:hypothetical protein